MGRTSGVSVALLSLSILGSPALAQPTAGPKPPAASPSQPAGPPRQPAVAPAALESPKPAPAAKFLGAAVRGSNYAVRPIARSDGIMRIFEVETPYGAFQFDGVEFTKMRLQELNAVAALERMSQSEAWAKSFGRAVVAPVKLGVDFVINPVDAFGRSMTGISNMFDRANASLSNQSSNRDTLADSLLGVSDAQRQLAVELGVDPYSDFPPLAQRLRQMAGAMAGGQLTVRAGLAAVTGGIGIGISAASNVEQAKDTLRDKTAAQVIVEVRGILAGLDVPEDMINRLVENRNYTPADLLIMSRALAQLGVQNTAAFVNRATDAASRGEAYFHRNRAELLAARRPELGGIVAFTTVVGHAVNITRDGRAIAVFPFDDLAWTELPARTFRAATAELRRGSPKGGAVFATTGQVTPVAAAEIKKLGWTIAQVKPAR
ncbi:MAG: hypothetical protein QOF91_1327 [Alphaproteobacteria bacterium]|nr:hypothetical protein [Alphaproteobacteria bacterium]